MEELLERMRRRVMRHADGIRPETPVPNLSLGVLYRPTMPAMTFCGPMICVVLQGAKQVLVGGSMLRYDIANCFASALELPATGCVLEAEANRPYVAAGLTLNRVALAALIAEQTPIPAAASQISGFGVAEVSADLLEAFDNLLALLDRPEDIATLAAGREREVLYRLLQGPHGRMMRQVVREGSQLSQIRRAIEWMRLHFDQTLRTEKLADLAGMSVPSFHRHFKAATAMSPLQYQKTLRLHAARRLLVTNTDASQTAYSVGYESVSQFSREYSRLFGIPPSKDAAQLSGGVGKISSVMI